MGEVLQFSKGKEMKILYNFATRSRPIRFFKALDNIKEMSASDNYIVLAKLDENDPSNYEPIKEYPYCIIVSGYSKSKVHAINRGIIPDGWDILINMSDDIRWTVKGFDDIIREDIEDDIFLHYPEPFADSQCAKQHKPPISVLSIMDKKYYDRFGYVYHNDYTSLWCDEEATEVARRLGRHKWVGKMIFSHDHPQAGKAAMDMQYRVTESFYSNDKRVYNKRKAMGFPL